MSNDPERIEERIEDTRARLSQNLGELGDRMSPGSLVDEALRYFESGPKDMAGSLGNQVRENPMAALLTAAGVAWMAMGRGKDPVRRYTDSRHPDYTDPYAAFGSDDDWDDDWDRTYSRLDTDHIPSTGSTYANGSGAASGQGYSAVDTGADYSTAETGLYGRRYDLSDDEYTTYRSSIDTYDSLNRIRAEQRRRDDETESAYYRRLDDSYASTLKIERNDGEDDDTYRARVRAAVDSASDKADEARRSLKQSASRARRRMQEMRRSAGRSASDLGNEASRRAAYYRAKAKHLASEYGDKASDLADEASRLADHYSEEAKRQAQMAKRKAAEFHDENPLVSGALALAAGALAGALFPVTEKEREALSPVADDLIHRGAELAEQGAERVEAYASKVESKAEQMRDEPVLRSGTTA